MCTSKITKYRTEQLNRLGALDFRRGTRSVDETTHPLELRSWCWGWLAEERRRKRAIAAEKQLVTDRTLRNTNKGV